MRLSVAGSSGKCPAVVGGESSGAGPVGLMPIRRNHEPDLTIKGEEMAGDTYRPPAQPAQPAQPVAVAGRWYRRPRWAFDQSMPSSSIASSAARMDTLG